MHSHLQPEKLAMPAMRLELSIFEIYMDNMFDLLNKRSKVDMRMARPHPLQEGAHAELHTRSGLCFTNLRECRVHSEQDVIKLVTRGACLPPPPSPPLTPPTPPCRRAPCPTPSPSRTRTRSSLLS